MANTGDIVSRIYSNFRGVDFRGDEINLVRSPDSVNMWKDYKATESIRTRPALRLNTAFTEPIYGIFFYKDKMLVHSGTTLYSVENGAKKTIYSGLNEVPSASFVYKDTWYFKDGKHYLQYNGSSIKEVSDYVPTTSIGRKPYGGGTTHEDVNLLTGRRINTFLADKVNTEFVLDSMNIDNDFHPIVKVNGELVDNYEVDFAAGKITFTEAPPAPLTDGQDNVSVEFKKTISGARDKIIKCTLLQVFDNRVFFSGNPDYPNTVWHCALNDPTYCSDLDYYEEGLDTAPIRGLVAGNNALWVFREPSDANTTVFYHTPTIDSDYGKIYPSQNSSITTGCVGKAINFNDDIVFFSDRGMEGISGDITTEQAIAHRSSLVDRKLTTESDYRDMVLEEWNGYLFVFIGSKAYLADSRAMFTNENHYEYDFYLWEMGKRITSAKVHNGMMYLGMHDGVYTLSDTESDVESWWTTPLDKFNAPHKLKTTNKRGCVVEAKGEDISLLVKTNNDNDWQKFGSYDKVDDAFVCKIKKKKFKDIRLKFYSKKRFSLESATLECFVGGYVKRI